MSLRKGLAAAAPGPWCSPLNAGLVSGTSLYSHTCFPGWLCGFESSGVPAFQSGQSLVGNEPEPNPERSRALMEGLFAGVPGCLRVSEGRDALGQEGIRSCQIPQWKGQWGDAVFWTEGQKVAAAPAKLSKDRKRTAGTVPQLSQGSTHSADEKTENQRRTRESSWEKAKFSAGSLCNLPGVSRRQGTAEPGTAAAARTSR